MSDATIDRIREVMRDLFDDYEGPITRDTTAREISQWDSLAHVQLLVIIEQTFRIRFASNEIHDLKCLGDLVDAIDRKQSSSR